MMWLAGCLPLAYYLASASAHGYWSEESALVGTTAELGIAHPPGAPLTSLVGSLLALLPIGPLAFRAAVASGVFVAISLALFTRATFGSLIGLGVRNHALAAWLALAAALALGQTPGVWALATRPDVYALALLLSMVVVDALVRFELSEPTDDMRTLYFAAFVQGLSFANHHVFALFTLAAGAPTLGRVFARRGFIGLMGHVAAPILGFSAYVYVPIRAGQDPSINVGQADHLAQLFWVLGADPWWGPSDAPASQVPETLWRSLSIGGGLGAGIALAIAAIALLLARRALGRRRFAVLWGILLSVPFFSLALLIRPTSDSETTGALFLCQAAVMALAALGIGLVVERFTPSFVSRSSPLAVRALAVALVLGFVMSGAQQGLARFDATDAVDDGSRRMLPPHAVLLTYDMATVFRHLGAEAEEKLRPDVTVVPLALVHEPWLVEGLAAQSPALTPVLRELLVRGELELASLQSLAAERPVVLELDRRVPPALYGTLVNEGVLSRVLPDGVTPGDERLAAAASLARWKQLDARAASLPAEDPGRARLARLRFHQALSAAALGDRATAEALLDPTANVPVDAALAAQLRTALAERGGKPVDPRPFVASQ